MDSVVLTAVIAGGTGLIGGAIGSLVAPWVNWGIEKRRLQLQERKDFLAKCREIIASPGFERTRLLNDPVYGVLRPMLTEAAIKQLERSKNHFVVSELTNADSVLISKELSRIGQTWDLL